MNPWTIYYMNNFLVPTLLLTLCAFLNSCNRNDAIPATWSSVSWDRRYSASPSPSPRVPRRIHQPRKTKDSTCGLRIREEKKIELKMGNHITKRHRQSCWSVEKAVTCMTDRANNSLQSITCHVSSHFARCYLLKSVIVKEQGKLNMHIILKVCWCCLPKNQNYQKIGPRLLKLQLAKVSTFWIQANI